MTEPTSAQRIRIERSYQATVPVENRRAKVEADLADFLAKGGAITQVPIGTSGVDMKKYKYGNVKKKART